MPRRLTRPEAITRIAITALRDAYPAMAHRQLVGFFHVSPRTVTEATRHAASYWASVLLAAPEPSRTPRPRHQRRTRAATSWRPGSRDRTRLDPPERTNEIPEASDFDVPEPAIDEDAQERAITETLEKEERKLRGVVADANDDNS